MYCWQHNICIIFDFTNKTFLLIETELVHSEGRKNSDVFREHLIKDADKKSMHSCVNTRCLPVAIAYKQGYSSLNNFLLPLLAPLCSYYIVCVYLLFTNTAS